MGDMHMALVFSVREGEAAAEPLSRCVYPGAPGLSGSFALRQAFQQKIVHGVPSQSMVRVVSSLR